MHANYLKGIPPKQTGRPNPSKSKGPAQTDSNLLLYWYLPYRHSIDE